MVDRDAGRILPPMPNPLRRIAPAIAALLVCSLVAPLAHAEQPSLLSSLFGGPPEDGRHFYVGSSLFMLANAVLHDHPPVFIQLNGGYRVTPKDTLSVEAITWRYYHPLGIPYGSSRESPEEEYPGHVREYGVGMAYQRFLWKGLYASLSAVPFFRQYYDAVEHRIGNGFQLFMTLRHGYQVRFLDRLFVEPSIAATFWPVSTNVPEAFAKLDRRWPRYFLFEPGFHMGVEL